MAPSVSILPNETGHFQAVRFYKDADSLARLVAEFVTAGFSERLSALVIATLLHLSQIVNELRAQAVDVDAVQRQGDLC
ncbi:MAG TPA: hypothetical protein VK504_28705 [Vicinamibacterales bacterium]|nr:hypothetical protein [Vicinamibacterales bacterium]